MSPFKDLLAESESIVGPRKSAGPHIQSQCSAVLARELAFWTASRCAAGGADRYLFALSSFLYIPPLVALRWVRVRNTELHVTSHSRTYRPKTQTERSKNGSIFH